MTKNLLKITATCLILLIVAPPTWAAPLTNLQYQEPEPVAPPSIGALLFRLIASLIVLVGLAIIGIKFLQKRSFITQTGHRIRIIDQVDIGPNKALLLSEIAGKIYVLGVTDHGISKLLEIEDTLQVAAILEESFEAGISPWEGGILRNLWRRKQFWQLFIAKKEGIINTREGK